MIVPALVFALAAGAATADTVHYYDAAAVQAKFARGEPLLETPHYKIHASRRSAPGKAEVHVRDTDIIHVLEGRATFVTGGVAQALETTAPDEQRGSAISGGDTRQLAAGDVIVVPNGTPHQFTAVTDPFVYYVVKVPAQGAQP